MGTVSSALTGAEDTATVQLGCKRLSLGLVVPAWHSVLVFLQGVAVLGIALIAMGEEIGAEMALRTFGHLVSNSGGIVWGWEGTWMRRADLSHLGLGELGCGCPTAPLPLPGV